MCDFPLELEILYVAKASQILIFTITLFLIDRQTVWHSVQMKANMW